MKFKRTERAFSKILAVIFLIVGVSGVLSAVSDIVGAILDRVDSGSWNFVPFMAVPVLRAVPHPTFVQQTLVWLSNTPRFVLNAVIGIQLLRMGSRRWIDADVAGRTPER